VIYLYNLKIYINVNLDKFESDPTYILNIFQKKEKLMTIVFHAFICVNVFNSQNTLLVSILFLCLSLGCELEARVSTSFNFSFKKINLNEILKIVKL
jgi:hypothetical protein